MGTFLPDLKGVRSFIGIEKHGVWDNIVRDDLQMIWEY